VRVTPFKTVPKQAYDPAEQLEEAARAEKDSEQPSWQMNIRYSRINFGAQWKEDEDIGPNHMPY